MRNENRPGARNEHGVKADLESAEREHAALRHVTDALAEDVKDTHHRTEVVDAVRKAARQLENAPVREFVPILVEREARATLCDLTASTPENTPENASDVGTDGCT